MFITLLSIFIIVAQICFALYWEIRKGRKGRCDAARVGAVSTASIEGCTCRNAGTSEDGILTAEDSGESGIITREADYEHPVSSSNELHTADISTTQDQLTSAEEAKNLGVKHKRNSETSQIRKVSEVNDQEDIINRENDVTDNTEGKCSEDSLDFKFSKETVDGNDSFECSINTTQNGSGNSEMSENTTNSDNLNRLDSDGSTSIYPNSSTITSDCTGSSETQNYFPHESSDETQGETGSPLAMFPEEQTPSDQSSKYNKTKLNETAENDTQDEIVTGVQQFSKFIDIRFKKKVGLNVVILHSEDDYGLAMDLCTGLKATKEFRVITQSEIESEFRMSSLPHKDVLVWANIIVPVITNTWLSEIVNISVPNDVFNTQRLNTRYIRMVDETMFVSNASLNDHSVPVVEKGTDVTYREYPDLTSAIPITKPPLQSEIELIGDRIIQKWNVRQSVQRFLSRT